MKNIYNQILDKTKKSISHNRYKTTSFTMIRQDYDEFKLACNKAKRKPSEVLRSLVEMFVKGDIK